MFGLNREEFYVLNNSQRFFDSQAPVIIEGADIIESLCPVNPAIGRPDSPLNCLRMALDPAKSRLLDAVLQELPVVASMDVSDDDKIDVLASRLEQGSFAERDNLVSALHSVADVLFPKAADAVKDVDKSIEFSPTDNPNTTADAQ